jgi:hypothetical protein
MNQILKLSVFVVVFLLAACGPIVDTTPPDIALKGDPTITIPLGETFEDPGVTVSDNVDSNLTASTTGTVNTDEVGTYTLTYSVEDSAGNAAEVSRTVIVVEPDLVDTESPVIALNGDSVITLTRGNVFTDPGATVLDNLDENPTLTITGEVDTDTVGNYTVTYSATDAAGNVASEIRTVIVELPVEASDSYIFHSGADDSYYMQYWGDQWGTETEYNFEPVDNSYSKVVEISKSAAWGTVIAWGNEPENTVDIAAYTHARFKVKSDTFTQVEVIVQSATMPESKVTYNFTRGADLENGWVEMTVNLPDFTDMTWFALNFIGDSGTVLLADVYFTELKISVTPPPSSAPLPNEIDDEVMVLFSDTLIEDSWISVWTADWWNAPLYAEGNIAGDFFAKYTITDGGINGGVVGLEYGFDKPVLNASAMTIWELDLFVETGITKVSLQLVSEDGGATYVIEPPVTGEWLSLEIPFASMTNNAGGVLNPANLQSIGIQLWGSAGQSVYLDNIYFSGMASYYDLEVTVTDELNQPIENATVSVGDVAAVTSATGVATLNLPEGEQKILVNAEGYGAAQKIESLVGADALVDFSLSEINPGPSSAAPAPTETDEEAFVIYSDSLSVDKPISYWSDNWWNAPEFSEVSIAGDMVGKLQIIPEGVAGGVTGIQYGIENGVLDATGSTRFRFDMFATADISQAVFQIVTPDGAAIYTLASVTTGEWVTVDLAFSEFVDAHKIDESALQQFGVQLWGTTSDAVYLDNIYFY